MDKTIKKNWTSNRGFQYKTTQEIRKSELYYATGDPEDCITEKELLRGDLKKLRVIINDVEMMTHIMFNLLEEYKNIVDNI